MTYLDNPFTPSFGEVPVHLAGRRQIVSSILQAFQSERRRPELTALLSGARGTGKTTLLSLLAAKAEPLGWISVETTARPGMLDDIEIGVRRRVSHLLKKQKTANVAGVDIAAIGGLSFHAPSQEPSNWRSRMEDILDQLEQLDCGLLITVDEIDPSLPDMIELAIVYQHFVREGRRVALIMAGLPHNVSALISDKTVSFLRRAQSFKLGRIADIDVNTALVRTISEYGREADPAGLSSAVKEISGFPFLMQLIGYRAWDISPTSNSISASDFQQGIQVAREEMVSRILETTYRELSSEDIRFLNAMLVDEEDSSIADITKRLNRSSSQVAQYRRRLIDAGVIGERKRGVVGFDLPYFRDYLINMTC